jgi:hypothetical protein
MANQPPSSDGEWKKLCGQVAEAGNAFSDKSPLSDAERSEAAALRAELGQIAKTHESRLDMDKIKAKKEPRR